MKVDYFNKIYLVWLIYSTYICIYIYEYKYKHLKMTLKKEVLEAINTPRNRVKIAAAMGLGEQTIRQYIIKNDAKLTQFAALQAIKEIMRVKKESDLLVEDETPVTVNG